MEKDLNPNKLKAQVGRIQELIFSFTKNMSKLKKELDQFNKQLD